MNSVEFFIVYVFEEKIEDFFKIYDFEVVKIVDFNYGKVEEMVVKDFLEDRDEEFFIIIEYRIENK